MGKTATAREYVANGSENREAKWSEPYTAKRPRDSFETTFDLRSLSQLSADRDKEQHEWESGVAGRLIKVVNIVAAPRRQSVNTASVPACPPSSRGGPEGVGSVGRAHTRAQDDHVLRVACGHGWVGASSDQPLHRVLPVAAGQLNGAAPKNVASLDGDSDIAWFKDGPVGAVGGSGGGGGEPYKSSNWNKTTSNQRSRTKGRSAVRAVGAATVLWIAVSHLILGNVAYSLESDPHSNSNASNAGYGNTYSNRFGRLLLNGTRSSVTVGVVATQGSSSSSAATHTTSTTTNTADRDLFDGGVEFVAADGTASAGFNDSSEMPQIPEYIRATSMVFCIIIMCLGVIGNIMVPIVILKTKDMRNSTNIFLTNLSIADLLVLLVCTPTVLVEVNSPPEVWVLGEEMCK
uniref:G-protein coupled receptors family 1 profile domain-containing protein n=1 Tax=Anopheles maculatus TaxID=74869 RepID=A0A182SEU7_9DIPT